MAKKIGIIGAMQIEIDLLTKQMQNTTTKNLCKMDFIEGVIANKDVIVVKSGVGKVNAAICATILIEHFNIDKIINTGIAGAVGAGLGVFDIVVSKNALYHDMDATGFGYKPTVIPQMQTSCFCADGGLRQATKDAFLDLGLDENHKLQEGTIATGDQFICSDATKEHIKEICSPACVEMEGAGIAHACYLRDVPFVIIRTLSDTADTGSNSTYKFNDKDAALMSAKLVLKMLEKI